MLPPPGSATVYKFSSGPAVSFGVGTALAPIDVSDGNAAVNTLSSNVTRFSYAFTVPRAGTLRNFFASIDLTIALNLGTTATFRLLTAPAVINGTSLPSFTASALTFSQALPTFAVTDQQYGGSDQTHSV
jgi:hypothetical protein